MYTEKRISQEHKFLRNPLILLGIAGVGLAVALQTYQTASAPPVASKLGVRGDATVYPATALGPSQFATTVPGAGVHLEQGARQAGLADSWSTDFPLAPTNSEGSTSRSPARSPSDVAEYDRADSRRAREMIEQLKSLRPDDGTLTLAQAGAIKEHLRDVTELGDAAVQPVREFLESMEDFDYSQVAGGQLLDYPTLRLNLIDVLNQIGSPEALDAIALVLFLSSAPEEVGLMASALETHAPGTYRMDILTAASETLFQIQDGALRNRGDPVPLFAVFQDYGDSSVMLDLEEAFPRWNNYVAAALAGLPEGDGVDALITLLDHPDTGTSSLNAFPLLMLAQSSRRYPAAGDFLVNLASTGQLSKGTMTRIGSVLAGRETVLKTRAVNQGASDPARARLTSPVKPQYFEFDVNAADAWSVAEIEQRLALIDRLQAAHPDPSVARVLDYPRNLLLMRLDNSAY